jgi:acyl-coenzyme A thioesterase PaaI-like protein
MPRRTLDGVDPRLREEDTMAVHPLVEKVLAARPPIAELIGFTVEDIGAGRAVGSLHAGPEHANPMGTLHGGILCDISDPQWAWCS